MVNTASTRVVRRAGTGGRSSVRRSRGHLLRGAVVVVHLLHVHLRLSGVQHVQGDVRLGGQLRLLLGAARRGRRRLRLQAGLVERLLLQRVTDLVSETRGGRCQVLGSRGEYRILLQ